MEATRRPVPEPSGRLAVMQAPGSVRDDCFARLRAGEANERNGEHLFVSPKTLEGHVSRIFMKLGLTDTLDDHRRVAAVLAYLGHRN